MPSVGVADANGGDPGWPLGTPGRVVADAGAARHIAHGQHTSAQPHGRRIGLGTFGGRIDAVESGARAREIGAPARTEEYAGRIGETARRRRQTGTGGGEAFELVFVQRIMR